MNLRDHLEHLLASLRRAPVDWLTLRLMRRLPLPQSPPRPQAATTTPVIDDDQAP